jgi:hypothetical protein
MPQMSASSLNNNTDRIVGHTMNFLGVIVDVGSCLVSSPLSAFGWWAALTGSVLFKRYKLQPWLERHYKTTYDQRLQLRKRQLRDTLNDPVLVLGLERSMEKKYEGNRKRILEAIEQLRQNAQEAELPTGGDDSEDHDANKNGNEKKQAAKKILSGTILIAVLWLNIFGFVHSFFTTRESCDDLGELLMQCAFFSLVHLVDSFMIYYHVHKKKQSRFARESVASSSGGDLQ